MKNTDEYCDSFMKDSLFKIFRADDDGVYPNRDVNWIDSDFSQKFVNYLTWECPQVCPGNFDENDIGLLGRVYLSQV